MGTNERVSFIGAGNMGGALIRSVCGTVGPENVWIYDAIGEKTKKLSGETGCNVCASARQAVLSAKFVFFCVKPQAIASVLEDVSAELKRALVAGEEKVAVSIAAGVRIEVIASIFRDFSLKMPVVRAMPNIPAAVGRGTILLSAAENVSDGDIVKLKEILSLSGLVEQADEHILDLATAISGSGPAFAYMFIEALADGGVQIGLPRDKAILYAASTVAGAAEMVMKTGLHPGVLKDHVCSPGGTTIDGVVELEKCAFRGAVMSAVAAANNKTKKFRNDMSGKQ